MTRVSPGVIVADDLSQAWLETTKEIRSSVRGKCFHTITCIANPSVEDPAIRSACDALLRHMNMQSVETVANTIFPKAMASGSASPEELVERYLGSYDTYRRFNGNNKGTYFGRIVAHPSPDGPRDQLVPLIENLRNEAAARTPMSARYEVAVAKATDVSAEDAVPKAEASGVDRGEEAPVVTIFTPHKDTSRRGFPCLSLLSFQLDDGAVHVFAHYRYEYLVAKGYGNYLGIARLLAYVADAAGLQVGQLTVAAGRIEADAPARELSRHFGQTWAEA